MRNIRLLQKSLLLAAVAISLLGAWRPVAEPLTLKPESRLWFDGKSTVRDWSCTAKELAATIDAEAGAQAAVLAGRKAVRTVELSIRTARLDCDNRTMNGHMMRAINATDHPAITFTLASYDVATSTAATGTLRGTLTIKGRPLPVVIPVTFAPADGALRVTGSYALNMTDWGVEPPKLMLGALKVNPMVTVNFDLLL